MDFTGSYWWWINVGSGNGLVPLGNKPLPEPMLTQIFVTTSHHLDTVSQWDPLLDMKNRNLPVKPQPTKLHNNEPQYTNGYKNKLESYSVPPTSHQSISYANNELLWVPMNRLRLRQNGRHFTDNTFNAFSWMKMYEFCLKFHWSLFLRVQLMIFQHWLR